MIKHILISHKKDTYFIFNFVSLSLFLFSFNVAYVGGNVLSLNEGKVFTRKKKNSNTPSNDREIH